MHFSSISHTQVSKAESKVIDLCSLPFAGVFKKTVGSDQNRQAAIRISASSF